MKKVDFWWRHAKTIYCVLCRAVPCPTVLGCVWALYLRFSWSHYLPVLVWRCASFCQRSSKSHSVTILQCLQSEAIRLHQLLPVFSLGHTSIPWTHWGRKNRPTGAKQFHIHCFQSLFVTKQGNDFLWSLVFFFFLFSSSSYLSFTVLRIILHIWNIYQLNLIAR